MHIKLFQTQKNVGFMISLELKVLRLVETISLICSSEVEEVVKEEGSKCLKSNQQRRPSR